MILINFIKNYFTTSIISPYIFRSPLFHKVPREHHQPEKNLVPDDYLVNY